MDACGIETLYLTPLESITDPAADPGALSRELRAGTGGRVRFLEVFDPRAGVENLRRIEHSLDNPDCVGVKIHPSFHETAADDERYEPIYALAERRQRPILTHSWDVSPTNPVQHLSHPDRFRALLGRHPGVRLVLGHAGGRPGALEAVGRLCGEFAGVRVDLAGDYYDNGLVECLAERIGVARVLFGSDVNWMDPRGNLAPVLASRLSDEEALGVLRGNALATYGR
jgi:predicted TIM-barrel fold metal-dependent hydrolase